MYFYYAVMDGQLCIGLKILLWLMHWLKQVLTYTPKASKRTHLYKVMEQLLYILQEVLILQKHSLKLGLMLMLKTSKSVSHLIALDAHHCTFILMLKLQRYWLKQELMWISKIYMNGLLYIGLKMLTILLLWLRQALMWMHKTSKYQSL